MNQEGKGLANRCNLNMVAPRSYDLFESGWATVAYHNGRCRDKSQDKNQQVKSEIIIDDSSSSEQSEQTSRASYAEVTKGKRTSSAKKLLMESSRQIQKENYRNTTPIKINNEKDDDLSTN